MSQRTLFEFAIIIRFKQIQVGSHCANRYCRMAAELSPEQEKAYQEWVSWQKEGPNADHFKRGAGIIEEANDQGLTVDYMESLAEVAITTSTADKNSSASEPSIASGNSAQTA